MLKCEKLCSMRRKFLLATLACVAAVAAVGIMASSRRSSDPCDALAEELCDLNEDTNYERAKQRMRGTPAEVCTEGLQSLDAASGRTEKFEAAVKVIDSLSAEMLQLRKALERLPPAEWA